MTKEEIKQHLFAAPFRPFLVRLPDGQTFPVPSPDYAHISPNGRLLSVYTHDGNAVRILDVALITEIQIQEDQAK